MGNVHVSTDAGVATLVVDHPREVERGVQPAEAIDAGRHVLEGGGPDAATAPAEPAVLEVPGGPAARGEIVDEPVLEPQAVARPPEPAVDEHRDRVRRANRAVGGRFGQAELAELIAPAAVPMDPTAHPAQYRRPAKLTPSPGRVAQRESARLTRERSLVRTQPRPSQETL